MDLQEISALNRVAIIDNDEEDGRALQRALQNQMIGSVFFHVNGLSGLPPAPLPNISLVFLDLDLISSVPNSRDKASRAVACLSRVVKPGSFYALVIWSTHTTSELENDFREILVNNDSLTPCVPPISLAKLECKNSNGYLVSKINRNMKKQFNGLKAQSLLFKWEEIVAERMSQFIQDLTKGDSQRDLSKKLHALADAYAGKEYSEDIAKNALFTLNEALKGSIDGALSESNLDVFNERRIYKQVGRLDDIHKSKINAQLMIDPNIKLGPGCVFECVNGVCPFHGISDSRLSRNKKKILIDLTPICDAAQKKNKINHFIHGMLIEAGDLKKINSAGYIHRFQNQFTFDGKSYYLVVNLKSLEGVAKRKTPGTAEKSIMKNEAGENVVVIRDALNTDIVEKVLFKFRDPVVLDLQQKSSSYMSRFGHTYLA